jgi:hypothetical protein
MRIFYGEAYVETKNRRHDDGADEGGVAASACGAWDPGDCRAMSGGKDDGAAFSAPGRVQWTLGE